jgi:ABC-2 type transport system ATP-binding protein
MTEPAIALNQLAVKYPARRQPVEALRGISLTVPAGTVFGFLGPNGAGKTTTLHVLLGFIAPTGGEARMFGADVRQSIARQRIGYLPEHPLTYPFLTGRECLDLAGRLFGLRGAPLRQRAAELIRRVGLEDAADRRAGVYSRGMLQRLGLAQALINNPDLVILDEPTSGLDPLGRRDIRQIIAELRDQGKTVFFSSHELSEVELVCDQVAILARGELVAQGKIGDLVQKGQRLEEYFVQVVQQ